MRSLPMRKRSKDSSSCCWLNRPWSASAEEAKTFRMCGALCFSHGVSGLVKPILERRKRLSSGIRPFIALR